MASETQTAAIEANKKPSKALKPIFMTVGAPEWVVTFGDMMSLLLTFFILLFSVSEMKGPKVFSVMMGFEDYFESESDRLGYYPNWVRNADPPGFIESGTAPPFQKGDQGRAGADWKVSEAIDPYASVVEQNNQQMLVIEASFAFERGKARLRQEALPTLLRVAARLERTANDLKVTGHTSSLPIEQDSDAKDPFSLGFLRALAVARFLSGGDGDLSELSARLRATQPDLPARVSPVAMNRFVIATHGANVPSPTRKNLWENPERDERVEVMPMLLPKED